MQVYAYTNEEKANAIALNLEPQLKGNNIVDYDTEREVNKTLIIFLREDILPYFWYLVTHTGVIKGMKKENV